MASAASCRLEGFVARARTSFDFDTFSKENLKFTCVLPASGFVCCALLLIRQVNQHDRSVIFVFSAWFFLSFIFLLFQSQIFGEWQVIRLFNMLGFG